MGRMRRIFFLGIAAVAIALGGCASMGLTLDTSVRVGIDGESGYAKFDFPASWHFRGIQGDQTVDQPAEGQTYSSVLVTPDDPEGNNPTAQVVASSSKNTLNINPDSSSETIYGYFDETLKSTFPDATVEDKSVARDGDSTIVKYAFNSPYNDKTLESDVKYILIGDYVYSISGSVLADADQTNAATVHAIVEDYGYVTNSQ